MWPNSKAAFRRETIRYVSFLQRRDHDCAAKPSDMKTTAELESLAFELMLSCREAANIADAGSYNDLVTSAARAAAKGRLLTQKLGTFGSIWRKAFDGEAGILSDTVRQMLGNAEELLDAVTKGRLTSIEERVSAAVLADLVEHAEVLIEQHFNLAAAVILRAVLEERLRKLCESHALVLTGSKPAIESFKQALAKANVIDKIVAKKIDWMAGVGNAAAHNLEAFNPNDVPGLYKDTLDFLDKFAV
jgi:hypothetical protein